MPTTRFDGPVPDPADPEVRRITEGLGALFAADVLKWKPQSVKGNRALAVAFIDARIVQERLDAVCGVAGWQDRYEILPDGGVVCSLGIAFGGRWVVKDDVGSPSEQPDGGDRLKAAFSDALKRAAIKFGIGRYLYRLPLTWCDYDPSKRQFVQTPQLPAWADPSRKQVGTSAPRSAPSSPPPPAPSKPAAETKAAGDSGKHGHTMPKSGAELDRRVREFDAKLAAEGLSRPGDLVAYLVGWLDKAGFPRDLTRCNDHHAIKYAVDAVKAFEQTRRNDAKAKAVAGK